MFGWGEPKHIHIHLISYACLTLLCYSNLAKCRNARPVPGISSKRSHEKKGRRDRHYKNQLIKNTLKSMFK